MNNFSSFNLSQELETALNKLKITEPTPIQEKSIPVALSGQDVIGLAQTGTGKTFAFGIPLIEKVSKNPESTALVLAPTRELATQVLQSLKSLMNKNLRKKTALLIGGESITRQFRSLKNNPQLIVGTPGRINDHLERESLSLENIDFLVLDETDNMLDMGFAKQIDRILKHVPTNRQTLMFSATMPDSIEKLAKKYIKDPVEITVGKKTTPAKKIKQEKIVVKSPEKYDTLTAELEKREGSVIVFVKTKFNAEKISARLQKENFESSAIHGNLRQNKRDRVIKSFRAQKYKVLVATDIAARGLDIPHIEHVINYDLPQCPEDYVHRIGRTARAGKTGEALSFVTPTDERKWLDIEKLIDPEKAKAKQEALRKAQRNNKKKPFAKKKWGNKKRFSKKIPQKTPHQAMVSA